MGSITNQRYARQVLLKELGHQGQEKLLKSKVLVIGAGGLGCPALQYIAAAGVGTIGIVDFDTVELSNLQRQTLYGVDDIGKPKAEIAAKSLKKLNPDIEIIAFQMKVGTENALDLISGFDVVIDGSDNFETRYLVNDACVLLDKPLVYGSVLRFEGQVGVFNLADKETQVKTNYRDLFPHAPDPESSLSCSDVGVLGILPGMIGAMQAGEAIKIITGIGEPLCNAIISYNALNNSFYNFSVTQSSDINMPQTKEEFHKYNYNQFCNSPLSLAEISVSEFDELRSMEPLTIIDVREKDELPQAEGFSFIQLPLSHFENAILDLNPENKMVLFCNTGSRSLKALKILKTRFPKIEAFNLTGGIHKWIHHKNTSP